MSQKPFMWHVFNLFPQVADMRAELRAQGQSEQEIASATERMVRHHLEPHAAPMHQWPEWALVPRCGYCDGTGLVIRRVIDKHKVDVDLGEPCRCPKGARFLSRTQGPTDHTAAGKTSKQKPMTRLGR